jgi:hypothetical protein
LVSSRDSGVGSPVITINDGGQVLRGPRRSRHRRRRARTGPFNGLLFQTLVDPGLAIEGDRFRAAEARLHEVATAG